MQTYQFTAFQNQRYAANGEVKAELPLPVAGLLADAPLAEVIAQSLACNDAAREVGWSGAALPRRPDWPRCR